MKLQLTIYFTYIFFVSVSIVAYSCQSDSIQTLYSNMENLKLAADRNPDNQRKWLELAKAYDSVGMKAAAGQARLAAQFTSTLKNK